MKYRLNKIDIYDTQECLFIYKDENTLLEVSGDGKDDIVKFLEDHKSQDQVNLQTYNEEMIKWLLLNRIIEEINDDKKKIKLAILGNLSLSSVDYLINKISSPLYDFECTYFSPKYEIQNTMSVDMIIIMGKTIANKDKLIEVNNNFYFKNTPIMYLNLSNKDFDIGPIFSKEMGTPCFESFIKRKIANLEDPSKYLKTLEHIKKGNVLLTSTIDFDNSYGEILLQHLKNELSFYFKFNLSNLLGTMLTLNFSDLSFERSKIVKVQNLSYENYSPLTPFD